MLVSSTMCRTAQKKNKINTFQVQRTEILHTHTHTHTHTHYFLLKVKKPYCFHNIPKSLVTLKPFLQSI